MTTRIVDPIFEQLGFEPVTFVSANLQVPIKTVGMRGVCLDLLAKTQSGKFINIEIQKVANQHIHRRASYHHSMIHSSVVPQSASFAEIPDTFVIFILERDIFQRGLPAYVTQTTFADNHEPVHDGRTTIFVCADYVADDLIGTLMNDFRVLDWKDVIDPFIRERIKYFKSTPEGRKLLMGIEEQIKAKTWDMAWDAATKKANISTAKSLLREGFPVDAVGRAVNLSKDKVLELKAEITNARTT